jgi:hypothetical protein
MIRFNSFVAAGVASLLSTAALADTTNGYGVATAAAVGDLPAFVGAVSAYRVQQDASGSYSTPADTLPVRLDTCAANQNPDFICSANLGGTSSTNYNLTASSNTASITTGLSSVPSSTGQGQASTYANLATGKLGGSSQGDYARQAYTTAIFNDRLTFNIPGATPTTVTQIEVSLSIDGSMTYSGAAFSEVIVQSDLRFGNGFARLIYGSDFVPLADQGGWVSGAWAASADGGLGDAFNGAYLNTFTGVYALVGAAPTLDVRAVLGTRASSVSSASFGNTAAFQMSLPSDVTYSSASGVFLSAAPVPEPETWAMMLAGMGVVGLMARRRRQGVA